MSHVPFLVELLLAIEVLAAIVILIVFTLARVLRGSRRAQRAKGR